MADIKIIELNGTELSIKDAKAREDITRLDSQFKDIAKQVENVGQPTQEQINTAINQAIADGTLSVGSGLSVTAKNLLQTVLQNAVYTTNQSANITALINAISTSEGGGDTPTTTKYIITSTLTNCTLSNVNNTVDKNAKYTTNITANSGCTLDSVTVTMGGVDITSTAYSNGVINIPSVTGNVVITVSCEKIVVQTELKEFLLSKYWYWTNGANSVKTYDAFEIPNFAEDIVSLPTSSSVVAKIECNLLETIEESRKRTAEKEIISGIKTTSNYLSIKLASGKVSPVSADGLKKYLTTNPIIAKFKLFDGVKSFKIPTTGWTKVVTHISSNTYHFEHEIEETLYNEITASSASCTNIGPLVSNTITLSGSKLVMTIPEYANNQFTADDVTTYYTNFNVTPIIYYV